MKLKLIQSEAYRNATPEERAKICNGCGAKGMIDFVPDKFGDFDMTEACNIHDWDYHHAKPNDDEKHRQDRKFLWNLVILALKLGISHLSKRLRICLAYYDAVSAFGHPAFWANKERPKTDVGKVVQEDYPPQT